MLQFRRAPAEVAFDAASHSYTHRGMPVPGVTSAFSPLHSFAGVKPEILQAAQIRGTATHLACQFLDEGDLDEGTLTDEVATRVDAWRAFTRDFRPTWAGIEVMVWSATSRYAGQVDRIGTLAAPGYADCAWTVDIKTAADPHPVMGLQTAAYDHAASPMHASRRRATVHLLASGKYEFHEWADRADLGVFLACLTLRNFKARIEA